jgi:predicted DNA-binding antitoxin AbrB/MazE fold protein
MHQVVAAIYADGVLRPLSPLHLADQEQVEIEVRQVTSSMASHLDERLQIHQALVAAGLIVNADTWTLAPRPDPISEEEQEELGRLFAVEKPLSEMIIEEREGY